MRRVWGGRGGREMRVSGFGMSVKYFPEACDGVFGRFEKAGPVGVFGGGFGACDDPGGDPDSVTGYGCAIAGETDGSAAAARSGAADEHDGPASVCGWGFGVFDDDVVAASESFGVTGGGGRGNPISAAAGHGEAGSRA